ncbi:hypothetical protein AVEN_84012-1 [Araneus ventricosus]|uniref:Uncharacterized protein n=1 Tax=Araneus ventricosus TaxID=182803 RepID=A0A4Y2BSU8_ARAVE|nr:hypothetical protein AVEN_84012-1 [Araneus ventricosus]
MLHAKLYVAAKRSLVGEAWKVGEGVTAQVSSSSSDHGSKFRGPSQNSPRVDSKWDGNITKLNPEIHFSADLVSRKSSFKLPRNILFWVSSVPKKPFWRRIAKPGF